MKPEVKASNSAVSIVAHGSAEYWQAVELRRRILRLPLGLDFEPGELEAEDIQTHFVFLRKGRVVGCLVMAPVSAGAVKMRQVAVEPELQGRGIGQTLVQASEAWSLRSGHKRIELNARDTAVGFYENLGYGVVGAPFFEVTIQHRKMAKDLEER